jgi:coatomer protein complex subunit epsilon
VIDFDTSSLSTQNTLPARVLALRARIGSGQAKEVMDELKGKEEGPELAAVAAYAQYAAGNHSAGAMAMDALVEASSDNGIVQVLGGTVLQAEGRSDEALALLAKHQDNLEAYARSIPSRYTNL